VKRVRVVVADDHPLVLQGIRSALAEAEDIEIVGEAESGPKVLALVRNTQPDFVLMDYTMPRFDGLACLDTLRSRHPEVKVAVLSEHQEPEVIEATLRRGACAFVLKSINPSDLASVIRQVVNRTVFQALDFESHEEEEVAKASGLTKREVSILQELAGGLSNEAIAKKLWITRETVKFHVRNIYRKLGVSNRTEAARYAYQHGLVANPVDELAATGA
jgi:two-component system, NarL family, response regulator DegU